MRELSTLWCEETQQRRIVGRNRVRRRLATWLHVAFLPCAHLLMFYTAPTLAQSAIGELRLKVTDPAGLALKAAVDLSNDGAQFRHQYETGNTGALTMRNLPFGLYQIRVEHEG